MGSRANRAEQKRRRNVIENPLRRGGSSGRNRGKNEARRGNGARRATTGAQGTVCRVFSVHSTGPPTEDLSENISCVHTAERTRSIVNGRLMEWNSRSRPLAFSSYTHTHVHIRGIHRHTGTHSHVVSAIPSVPHANRKIVAARAPPPLLFSFHGTTSTVDLIRFFSPSPVALLFPSRPVFSLVLTHPHLHFFSRSLVRSFRRDFRVESGRVARLRAEKSQISFSSLSFLFFPSKRTAAAQRGTRISLN